jgi:hypothetical protein
MRSVDAPVPRGRFGAGARCAGCRIDSGSAAFKKTALAVGKAPSDEQVYDEKEGVKKVG